MRAVLGSVLILVACAPAAQPPPGPAELGCAAACSHLRELGCETGRPTPEGTTCEEICGYVEATGVAEIRWPHACVAAATSCDVAERCGE